MVRPTMGIRDGRGVPRAALMTCMGPSSPSRAGVPMTPRGYGGPAGRPMAYSAVHRTRPRPGAARCPVAPTPVGWPGRDPRTIGNPRSRRHPRLQSPDPQCRDRGWADIRDRSPDRDPIRTRGTCQRARRVAACPRHRQPARRRPAGPGRGRAGPCRRPRTHPPERSGRLAAERRPRPRPITFTVDYRNREGSPADWVRVVIGGTSHDMHVTGPDDWKREVHFTWSGKLPAGTHDVTFEAMSRDRFSDELAGGSVTITTPPTPAPTADAQADPHARSRRPKPTPKPTPTAEPTPQPTPTPTAPRPAPTIRPRRPRPAPPRARPPTRPTQARHRPSRTDSHRSDRRPGRVRGARVTARPVRRLHRRGHPGVRLGPGYRRARWRHAGGPNGGPAAARRRRHGRAVGSRPCSAPWARSPSVDPRSCRWAWP